MLCDSLPNVGAYRALIYVPADAPRMVAKAPNISADAIILDLEDAVAGGRKAKARQACISAAEEWPAGAPDLWVRINTPDTEDGRKDLAVLGAAGVRNVVLPKIDASTAAEFVAATSCLGLERNLFHLLGLVESARGLLDAAHLGNVLDGLLGLQLGAEDLSVDMGLQRTVGGDEIAYARHVVAVAAHAQGIAAIDTPSTDYVDLDFVRADAKRARHAGFTGKTCIHPAQIATVLEVFSPTAQEIDHARKVVDAFDLAEQRGEGTTSVDGQMIDAPIAKRARAVLVRSNSATPVNEMKGYF